MVCSTHHVGRNSWQRFITVQFSNIDQSWNAKVDIDLISNAALLYITSDYWRCCWRLSSPWWWVARRGPTRSHLHPRYSYIDTDSTLSGHVTETVRINSSEIKHLRSIWDKCGICVSKSGQEAVLIVALHELNLVSAHLLTDRSYNSDFPPRGSQ